MAVEKLYGFLRVASSVVFSGVTPLKEARHSAERIVDTMPLCNELTRVQLAERWMSSTAYSDLGKTGVDQISLLVFSKNRSDIELAARVLKNSQIYLAACTVDTEQQRPTQWITRMVQSESAFVRGTAFDLIGEFELDDIHAIREAMGIEPKQPAFVDSREPD